jgi:hypothetical protein
MTRRPADETQPALRREHLVLVRGDAEPDELAAILLALDRERHATTLAGWRRRRLEALQRHPRG